MPPFSKSLSRVSLGISLDLDSPSSPHLAALVRAPFCQTVKSPGPTRVPLASGGKNWGLGAPHGKFPLSFYLTKIRTWFRFLG